MQCPEATRKEGVKGHREGMITSVNFADVVFSNMEEMFWDQSLFGLKRESSRGIDTLHIDNCLQKFCCKGQQRF